MTVEELKEILESVSDRYEIQVLGVPVDSCCFKVVDRDVVININPPVSELARKLGKDNRCEHAEDCCHFSEAGNE